MRALNPRMKRPGLIAALLAGVLLVSVDEAGARGMGGMSGHVGLGNGHPPSYGNSMKSGNPGSGSSKPGKTYGHRHDHDKDRKGHKRITEVRDHGSQPTGQSSGGYKQPVTVSQPGNSRDHRTQPTGQSAGGYQQPVTVSQPGNSRDHRTQPTGQSAGGYQQPVTVSQPGNSRDHRSQN